MKVGDNAATNMMNFATSVKKNQQTASAPNQGVGQAADPDKDGDNEATETGKAAQAEGSRGKNVDTTA